jgi:hypothetical protein
MSNEPEFELDFVRYQELKPVTVSKRDEKWMNSKDAKREVKAHAKEDRKRGFKR